MTECFIMHSKTLRREVDFEREEDIAAREKNKRIYADKSRHHTDIPGIIKLSTALNVCI